MAIRKAWAVKLEQVRDDHPVKIAEAVVAANDFIYTLENAGVLEYTEFLRMERELLAAFHSAYTALAKSREDRR
jgi:hypothetical protein